MRSCVAVVVLVIWGAPAYADDGLAVRMRRASEVEPGEPMLHLHVTPLAAEAEGGAVDRAGAVVELGPLRLAGEGTWWQAGLAPSMFLDGLPMNGWRAAGELSLDAGWFRVGANVTYSRTSYELVHKTRGLFVAKTFELSRWMRGWIMLGVSDEEWQHGTRVERGRSIGVSIGTTFR